MGIPLHIPPPLTRVTLDAFGVSVLAPPSLSCFPLDLGMLAETGLTTAWRVFARSAELLHAYPDDIDGDRFVDEVREQNTRQ